MYILKCADGSFYTGSTVDLLRRLKEHQSGYGSKHTMNRLPVDLIYFEYFDRIDLAFYREKQVQRWTKKKKEALIRHDLFEVHQLAECQNDSHSKNKKPKEN